jgi:WD40 repeat protein
MHPCLHTAGEAQILSKAGKPTMSAPVEIFCCYAREDQQMLEHLKKHLMPLQRSGLIHIWSDTNLNAGQEWEKELHLHLESADIILLLISPDFISSEYCYSTEMKRAIERHDQGSAHVIPILLRSTFWRNAPFAKLQIVPTNAKPVKGWSDHDEAFHDITIHVNQIVTQLQTRRTLDEAHTHENAQRYKDALGCYEQILSLESQNGPALFSRARTLYHLGEIDASIEAFTLAEQTAPAAGDISSYLCKADALQQRERYAESLTIYDQALHLDPSKAAPIHAKRATILIKQRAYEQALNALEQARYLEPDMAEYYTQAGELLFRLCRFEQALVVYEQAGKLQPREAKHREWQGRILLYLERYEDALAAYKLALVIAPQTHSYEQAGKICLQLARYQEALEMYELAIQTTNEHNSYLYAGKGQALLQLERYEEALSCYQTAIKLSAPETDPQLYHDLGALHERLAQRAYGMERQRRVVWQPKAELDTFLVPATAFDPAKVTLLHTLHGHSDEVNGIAISPNGNILASASNDNTIKLWELPSGHELLTLTSNTAPIRSVVFSPDGQTLASGGWEKTIKLWELPSGRELRSLFGHMSVVPHLVISSDGKFLASCSNDKTIKLWELSSGHELRTLTGHTSYVWSVAFSPEGNTLASGGDDSTIKLWELPSGHELRALSGHTGHVCDIAISPDGKTFASASGDKTIKLWELPSGHELRTLTGHKGYVLSVAFSPDGKFLASGSDDNIIKLWELPSGYELRSLTGHTDSVLSVTFSPDGKTLASASSDGTIKLWGMEP